MVGGTTGKARRAHDFYPTPPGTTRPILPLLREHFPLLIWEPCCGDGAISEVLKADGKQVVSTDLIDRGYGEGVVDFLNTGRPLAYAIVTNPPFNLVDEIINHAFCLLDTRWMALLLPAGFWHAKSRTLMFERYPPALVMPLTWRIDSTGEGRPTMNLQWVVWLPDVATCEFRPLTTDEKYPGMLPVDPLS